MNNTFGTGPAGPHAFLRDEKGNLTIFDPPESCGTYPYSVNDFGAIAGYFGNCTIGRGFLRNPRGNFSEFDAPGAVYQGANPLSINNFAVITGYFYDGTNEHGFEREPKGNITTFDGAPGAPYTWGIKINDVGTITGYVILQQSGGTPPHGFVRAPKGNITIIDPFGAWGTNPTSISLKSRPCR